MGTEEGCSPFGAATQSTQGRVGPLRNRLCLVAGTSARTGIGPDALGIQEPYLVKTHGNG